MKLLTRKTTNETAEQKLRADVAAAKEQLRIEREALRRLQAQVNEDGRRKLARDLQAAQEALDHESVAAAIDGRESNPALEDRLASIKRRLHDFDTLQASQGMRAAIASQAEKRDAADSANRYAQTELFRELARPHCEVITQLIDELGSTLEALHAAGTDAECGYRGDIVAKLLARPDDWITDVSLRQQLLAKAVEANRHYRSHRKGAA